MAGHQVDGELELEVVSPGVAATPKESHPLIGQEEETLSLRTRLHSMDRRARRQKLLTAYPETT